MSPPSKQDIDETSESAAATNATEDSPYMPPKVWQWIVDENSNKFATLNRPTAGPRSEKDLPVGKHALQLYSLATPNGQKVTILLEELLELGIQEADYDAWLVDIMNQDQFTTGFCKVNPNSKIPALMDYTDKEKPVRVFESGAMLLYLSEKFGGAFVPPEHRQQVLNWIFWQMGAAPYLGGGFGHFFAYAKEKQQYPIDRFTMEAKRQLDLLNNVLKDQAYVACGEYTLADIAIWPWYGRLVLGYLYEGSKEFLNVDEEYPHVIRWAKEIATRKAVQRGIIVNKSWGTDGQLPNRHDASDFDGIIDAKL
ncbi:hypothetical protein HJC23_013108 [Cyclotella cryptica]|uniref:Glutathione S-transferase n=1 Tax=Cyclotella cryptica TaxID=29204 RepID=A0ABD3QMI1_9STRA|eukprot:CCRYP_003912-RA/>CCRYP_003912-RA protein AED:0.41 eAED:0.41 QI:0/-1/0/1/-1/1/1/0/309